MDILLGSIVAGLLLGMVIALVALGLTIIFGVMDIVNFAHGEFYMLGGYTIWLLAQAFTDINPLLVVPIAGLLIALIGMVFEIFFLRPMHEERIDRPAEYAVLITFGLSFLLLNLALAVFGPYPHSPPPFVEGSVEIGPVSMSADRLIASLISLLLVGLLLLIINKTWIGKALRAVSQDKQAATVVGVNPGIMNTLAFALGTGIAAMSGALLASNFSVTPDVGAVPAIRSYIIIVLGGMGSIPGSILGGLTIGLVESYGAGYFPDPSRALNYKTVYGLVIFALVLLFRPRGFFGRKEL